METFTIKVIYHRNCNNDYRPYSDIWNILCLVYKISISAYSLTDEQITFRLELLDGYCGGTIKTYTDENRNLYISVLRTVIKEELSDGETEIMNYGFNHEKKDYIAVYYGTPNNCELIWKKGDLLPTAPKDIFE